MKDIIFLTACSVLFVSCDNKERKDSAIEIIKTKCNHVTILYYNASDTNIHSLTESSHIKYFTNLIYERNETEDTPNVLFGRIIFKEKEKVLLEADLLRTPLKNRIEHEYITYKLNEKKYTHSLSYNTGMLLNEYRE